ncbi:hypothetical protein [Ralstonia solanacearum]|uniref:hypothetical protein n=1 Tax=Ralstonia solanacearum TaxID=305 RepID=UPI003CC506DD
MSTENQQLLQSEPPLSCHFLIRPAAYVGEHPFGYKLRLAYVNGLADPRWMDMLKGAGTNQRARARPVVSSLYGGGRTILAQYVAKGTSRMHVAWLLVG